LKKKTKGIPASGVSRGGDSRPQRPPQAGIGSYKKKDEI